MDTTQERYGDDFGGEQMWGLKELAFPDAIPFLPQTAGWLVVGLVLLALLAWLAWRARRRWLKNAYRREALASIEAMRADPAGAAQLPFILRRSALAAYERRDVAGLRGTEWTGWLNESAGRELFTADAALTLDRLAYGREELPLADVEPLLVASRDWVRLHRA
jgi:hypothetical protein